MPCSWWYISLSLSPVEKISEPRKKITTRRPLRNRPPPSPPLPTTSMDRADIYLRPDTSYVRLPNDDVMPAVVLLIYGTTYALTVRSLLLIITILMLTITTVRSCCLQTT